MDSAVQQVTSYATGHADREIGYLVQFRRNTKNLEDKAQKLECTRNDLQRLISVAMNNNEVIRSTVTAWLEKVDIILDESTKLKTEAEKINRWYKGFIYSRFRLGRKALKKTVDIQELIDERNTFGDLADPKPFQSMQVVTDGEFDAFASREDTARKIFEALHDERKNLVGIFGMPGVGKTMLMQAILKEAKEKKLFDEIVMVTVSQHPDVERIQQGIAVQLGIHLAESSIAATQLSERLKQGKKILIALDDMWERLDLGKLGIPYKNIQGCKVLFTTRIEEVCDQMEAPAKIKVGILSKEDSRTLFRQKAGNVMDSSSHKEVAEDVLNECKGLPLAIATLGLALRNKDEIVWLDARTQLQTSSFEGMDPVVSVVKLSYQFLKNETCRRCFLFCCLFPEDFVIQTDVLLSYMLGEKLLKNVYSIAEANRRLHTIVEKLTSSGLLLKNGQGNIVMHDVIRDTAISIASGLEEGEGFIVMSGLRLELWPDINLENCKRLSLMSNDLKFEIPLQIRAPYLLTLCLSENGILKEIPQDFFKEMTSLGTLDLSCTDIESLPLSFPCLENLRTLRMDNCSRLTDISLVVS